MAKSEPIVIDILRVSELPIHTGAWNLNSGRLTKFISDKRYFLFTTDMIKAVKRIDEVGTRTVFELLLTNDGVLTAASETYVFNALYEYQYKSKAIPFKLDEIETKKKTSFTEFLFMGVIILGFFLWKNSNEPSTTAPAPVQHVNKQATVKKDVIDHAFDLCDALNSTMQLSSECKVSTQSVDISIDANAGEARQVCSSILKILKNEKIKFDEGWKVRIFSPFSADKTIAICKLPS